MFEMITGRPIFNARDENELIEMLRFRIGLPPQHMLKKASKRYQFFDSDGEIIRSKKSRVPTDSMKTIKDELEESKVQDVLLVDFLEKCLAIDPEERLTPE